jgi:multisubunit Na+/H+ antiporter MnhB subunit
MNQNITNKLDKLKNKYGFDDESEDISKRKISAKKEIKEIYTASKEESNLFKGLLLSPLFAYFSQFITLLFDAFPFIDLNVQNNKTVIVLHHIKMLISTILIFLAYYSISHKVNRQPIRLLVVIGVSIISTLLVIGTLINKIIKVKNEKEKFEGSDIFSIILTSISLLISLGFVGHSFKLYFGDSIRFVDQNMYVIIAKMVISIVSSLASIYSRI